MFSLTCNLLKMKAYFDDVQKTSLTKNACNCNWITSNQIVASVNSLNHFKDQISKKTTRDTSQYVATTSQRRQSHLGTSWNVSVTCQVGQSHLGTSWYIATTSQIGQFHLCTSETSQRCLKEIRFIDVTVETS